LEVKQIGRRKAVVRLAGEFLADLSEVFLQVDYEGGTGIAFIDGRLVADHFNNGMSWIIRLKRFRPELLTEELCLVFSAWRRGVVENTSSQLAGRFEFEGEERLEVQAIAAIPEYRTCLEVENSVSPPRARARRTSGTQCAAMDLNHQPRADHQPVLRSPLVQGRKHRPADPRAVCARVYAAAGAFN
jgi:hypothetical protein